MQAERPLTHASESAFPGLPAATNWLEKLFQGINVPGEIELPKGDVVPIGRGAPHFRIVVHSSKLLLRPHDEMSLGQAYVKGEFDLEGDMLRHSRGAQAACRPFSHRCMAALHHRFVLYSGHARA